MENTGAKMKKLAINFLKTADEKLRNIGKSQSATVLQTQNFTFYKNQSKGENESPVKPQIPFEQQSTQQAQLNKRPNEATRPRQDELLTEDMDERIVLRQVRREKNGHRASGEAERAELKRRSRSEGPNRRIRQSMDERENGKKQTFDGGGKARKQQESSDSDESDRSPRQASGCVGFDSDSDSDHKKWTKNPLVVRRVKKSDKTKQVEKRFSGTENGVGVKNMDSWVYYGNEDGGSRTGSLGGGNSSSRDSGSSAKGSSKYHKLEEMRKKRINLAVTSDEENTPASRISRLRQRALQGGLGGQLKSTNAPQASAPSYSNAQGDEVRRDFQPRPQSHQALNSSSPVPGYHNRPAKNSDPKSQTVSAYAKQQPVTNQLIQSPTFTNQPLKPTYSSSSSTSNQNIQPFITKPAAPTSDSNRGLNQLPSAKEKTTIILQPQPMSQKQPPARPPPPNLPAARQSFYTIPEPNSSQTSRSLSTSSPEVVVRRFTTQVRIPTTDSIINSTPKSALNSGTPAQPVTFSHNLRQIQARGSPTPNQELFQVINNSRSASQFNDVVEMRLKTNRDSRIEPKPRLHKKPAAPSNSYGYSDDTLDELVESNIQYLDSEVDKSKPKKNSSTSVSRSSSLPDPRRPSTNSGSTPSLSDQPSIQVQASNSIQIHVSLPTEHRHSGGGFKTPIIQIAPSSVIAYKSDYAIDNHLASQPDVVPRKYSYDSHARMSRPNSEHYDRDDMSKSDSQLNAQVMMIPSYLGNNLHPDQAYARGCVSDINLRSDSAGGLRAPQADMGMFSDVEYDIQVSDRVKKWETYMKVHDGQIPNEQKCLNLTTIQENTESDSLMLPSEIRKSVLLSKSGGFGLAPSYPREATYTPPTRPRPFSSDTALNKSPDSNALRMLSAESNSNRFFQIIPDLQLGPRLGGIQTQSVTSLFHTPVSSRYDNTFLTANELRQQMMANRQPALQINRGPAQSNFPSAQYQLPECQTPPQKDMSLMTRSSNLSDFRDAVKRGSRYHDELNEISSVKADSVINLRRRFGADSAAGTSEDDQWSVSTASAKLSRPSKTSPSHSETDFLDLASVLPGYDTRIKDGDVWSPNLETTHGVPVSIERVTARTLQTIPFSEDPFWKEIEEMTSFDPNSMAGHLSVSKSHELGSAAEPLKTEHQGELTTPHSSTLPTQPRSNAMTLRDRMQRSKSLYTPNITPLSINVSEKSSSAVSALDDVLEDISRSSIERKQLSPKKKAFDTATSTSAASGDSNVPGYLKMKQGQQQSGFKFEGGQFTFMKPGSEPQPQATKPRASTNLSQSHPDTVAFKSQQPLQFYQQQRKDSHQQRKDSQQQAQNRQSQLLMSEVNNYHLDPNLLKQKLLNTGLVVETDTEEPIAFKQTRSSSLGSSAPVFVAHSTASQSYTPLAPKSVKPEEPVRIPSSYTSVQFAGVPPVEPNPAAPWAAKQPGPSALYDIQKALAPFESSSYQPDPETLYGTSRLQSFNEPNVNTSRGPHVTATSWTYQPQLKQDTEANKTSSASSNSLSRLQEVNASMDDLKDLAQNVERKINAIKGKLQSADEKSLDSILASLRKLTPEVKSQITDGTDFDDYYSAKKSKLSDALAELNRIYDDLELSNDGLSRLPERGKHKPYRASKSDFVIAPVHNSQHMRPTQTRISSVFIPGLERNIKQDLDKETESEFDILSKSFQAIVDEVSQSTNLFSRVPENSGPENVAPETQNQASKMALKPESSASIKAVPTSCPDNASAPSKCLPVAALKSQEVKPKGGRFRAKMQGNLEEDDPTLGRGRSKSIPGLESNSKDFFEEASVGCESPGSSVSQTSDTSSTKQENSFTNAAASSPASRQRLRVRPVRDNKIIQDDKVAKKHGPDKVSGISQSPQPSPIVSRKIVYNSGLGVDGKTQPLQMTKEEPIGKSTSQQHILTRQHTNSVEEKLVHKFGVTETKPAAVSSPASQKKVPPPTAAKPNARSEASLPNTVSSTLVTSSISIQPTSQHGKLPQAAQLNSNTVLLAEKNSTSSGQKKASTTVNINLAPVVSEPSQSKPSIACSKHEDPDTNSSGGQRAKRRLGTGVAMILDKFTPSEDSTDRIKKRSETRSAPDLIESLNVGEDEIDNSRKVTSGLKIQPKSPGDNKQPTPKLTKPQTQRPIDKRTPSLALDGNKSSLSKSVVVSSFERKVVDPEVKTSSSGTTTPQPSSPNNKPPQHPWKRQMSDPDRQLVSDTISELSISSPKFVSKIPRLITTPKTAAAPATSDDTHKTQRTDNQHQKSESPGVTRRARPPGRKMQTETLRDRPHSFHELISCFEETPNRLQGAHRFRKYASADEVNPETLVQKVFLSELRSTTGYCLEPNGEKGGVVFKFEMKLKS